MRFSSNFRHAKVVELLLFDNGHDQNFATMTYTMPDGYNALHMACGNG